MTEQSMPGADGAERAVRVFVSSTFRDMWAEREVLVKRIFPQLRKLCEERGVSWGEVDLRWGITDEQKAEGRVLPVCLEEIERCRPYFIGLLGERYGWVPHEIEPALIEREPWLSEHRDRSVTELEIVHGVLRNPETADRAFFYLRDPAYIESLPAEEQEQHRELASHEDVRELGAEEAERRAKERREKLRALKERIQASGRSVRGYHDPRALGELVLEDLARVIDRVYPEGSEPDPLAREAADHEAFARTRAAVYVGRPEYFERLDAHARGDGPPLVVLGESGAGKSALLATWALRHRAGHPEELVLLHFTGSSPYSAGWAAMLRRVMGELARRWEIEDEIPEEPEELRQAFANWLRLAAARGRTILVLDALNQLEDREGAPDLVWLPPQIPANVRLIVSTLPGRPLEALTERGWTEDPLRVEPLRGQERERLIREYLARYTKELGSERVGGIAAAPQSANPLYLRALLEELRLWGEHETLDKLIDDYLAAATVDDLYELILERYERDYEAERPGLVGEAMSLIWAARRGVAEPELLDLLGSDGAPLPGALWSPLHLAAEQSLASRAGLIGFSHDYFRQAVRDRYLPSEQQRHAAHVRLADYLDARRATPRGIDELPWQLAEAGSWERLRDLLADLPFFSSAWDTDRFDVHAYWARIEASSPLRLVDAYRAVLDQPARHPDHAAEIAALLHDAGHLAEALILREHLTERHRENGDRSSLARALGNQAVILMDRGELDGAMSLLREQEGICRELGDGVGLAVTLGNQAQILAGRGELEAALALSEEEERICRELGARARIPRALGSQARILRARGDLDGAMALLRETERICRELGDGVLLALTLGEQAQILADRGEFDGAMALARDVERIGRELGVPVVLQESLGRQAMILRARGDLDGAMARLKEQERICRELGDPAWLATSLGRQAVILHDRGDLDGAMALMKEQERICRELGDPAGLKGSLGNQAVIRRARGDLDGAMALHKEDERICRELGDPAGLARSLGNQAVILMNRGELDGALSLLREQERICRDLGDRAGLATSLGNHALILAAQHQLDGAIALHKEEERICRELGDPVSLQRSLGNQALILAARGEFDGAMALHKEEERICRELGDPAGLVGSLSNQSALLHRRGELDGALALMQEEERICRELGDEAGLQRVLGNQEVIRKARGGSRRRWRQ